MLISPLYLSACCANAPSCTVVKLWDGDYSMHNSARDFNKEQRLFYESESNETKLLRSKNEQYCNNITIPLFNKKRKSMEILIE